MSWLCETEQHTIAAIAAHITAELPEWEGKCPGLREAACSAPGVSQGDFVAAAVSIGINPATATIQFRKQRAFAAGLLAAEAQGDSAVAEFLGAHRW